MSSLERTASETEIAVRKSTLLEAVFGLLLALFVLSGCAYLVYREWYIVGNNITGWFAAALGAVTLACVARDAALHRLSLMSWWLLVAAFQVIVCIALA